MALSKAHLALALSLTACTSSIDTDGPSSTSGAAGSAGTGGALPTSSSTTSGGGSGGIATAPTPIVGTAIDRRYHHGALVAEEPRDLTAVNIAAVVLQQGTWQTYPGAGHADGTFEIPGVPEGAYWFVIDGDYRLTTERERLIEGRVCGRADAVPASPGTALALDLDGLHPVDGGHFGVGSPDVDGSGELDSSTYPPLGDTSGTLVNAWQGGLLSASKGDELAVTQESFETSSNGWPYSRLARSGLTTGIDLADGATTSVSMSLPEPAFSTFDIDFRGQEFLDRMLEAAPLPTLQISAYVDIVAREEHFCGLTQLVGWDPYPTEVGDAHVGLVSFAAPPYAWPRRIDSQVYWYPEILAPGAQEPYYYPQAIHINVPEASGPIRPVVTPARDIQVNGWSAFVPLEGVGTSPVVTWQPPAMGEVTEYRLSVVRVYVDVGGVYTGAERVALLRTPDTSVTVPPGLMVAGERYMLIVSAYHAATATSGPDSSTGLATNPTALITP